MKYNNDFMDNINYQSTTHFDKNFLLWLKIWKGLSLYCQIWYTDYPYFRSIIFYQIVWNGWSCSVWNEIHINSKPYNAWQKEKTSPIFKKDFCVEFWKGVYFWAEARIEKVVHEVYMLAYLFSTLLYHISTTISTIITTKIFSVYFE